MKKLLALVVVVGLVVMGIGYVKNNDDSLKTRVGDYVVELDVSDGVTFDVHERSIMDSLSEAGSDMIDEGRTFIDNCVYGLSEDIGD